MRGTSRGLTAHASSRARVSTDAEEAIRDLVRVHEKVTCGRRIEEIAKTEPVAEAVARISALRGISTHSPMTILAEACDFSLFGDAGSRTGFTGLTHSEH